MLNEYLTTQHDDIDGVHGVRSMMRRRLKNYFYWKGSLGKMARNLTKKPNVPTVPVSAQQGKTGRDGGYQISAALKRKADYRTGTGALNKRRRVRGGGAGAGGSTSRSDGRQDSGRAADGEALAEEAGDVADL